MHSKAIITNICYSLSSDEGLSDVTVTTEFPSQKQDLPLNKTVISVGLEGVTVSGPETDVPITADVSPIYYGIGLTLCVPKFKTGTECHNVVDRVLKALTGTVMEYAVTDLQVGAVKYSDTLGALTVSITLRIYNGNAYKQ